MATMWLSGYCITWCIKKLLVFFYYYAVILLFQILANQVSFWKCWYLFMYRCFGENTNVVWALACPLLQGSVSPFKTVVHILLEIVKTLSKLGLGGLGNQLVMRFRGWERKMRRWNWAEGGAFFHQAQKCEHYVSGNMISPHIFWLLK